MKGNQGFLGKWLILNQEQEVHKTSLLDSKEAMNNYCDNGKQRTHKTKDNTKKGHTANSKGLSLAKDGQCHHQEENYL